MRMIGPDLRIFSERLLGLLFWAGGFVQDSIVVNKRMNFWIAFSWA